MQKTAISRIIDEKKEVLCGISDFLYRNPEIGYKEKLACGKLTSFLENEGFNVEIGVAGVATAFTALYDSGKPGASIGFLCEYDALPEIGHGCGHNIIAAIGVGAGAGLKSVIDETGGKVLVFGTPAEETGGGKSEMDEAGLFDGIDFAMMMHPNAVTVESGTSLAMDAWQFEYFGKAAHAAGCPEEGISALDAVIHLFNGINAFRQFLKSDARIHGIINNGGAAPNIVPEYASARFYVRAGTRSYLDKINKHVFEIADSAAAMTGATVKISKFENSFNELVTNVPMSKAWAENIRALGIEVSPDPRSAMGSTDMGNISTKVPCIHPYIDLGEPAVIGHTKDMADRTVTDIAHSRIILGAKSLAHTGFDLLTDKELAQRAVAAFKKVKNDKMSAVS